MHVDGQYAFSLHVSVAAGLAVGQQVTDDLLAHVNHEEERAAARVAVERYISYRPRSEAEVRRYLTGKQTPEALVDELLREFTQRGLIDDAAFARYWLEQRESFRPRSGLALRQELAQKGVSRRLIDEVLVDQDDRQSARAAAEKRLSRLNHLSEDAFRLQLGRYLQRRGFGYATVKTVVNEMWREANESQHPHKE